MSKAIKDLFSKFIKSKATPKTENFTKEGFKMNVKGQRVVDNESGPNLRITSLDNELYKKEKGPIMLNSKVRFKVWMMMSGVILYFYVWYKLLLYRLKSDDLDLMEREVKEEETLKTKIKELSKI